jgi:hypothetical protein
MTRRKNQFVNTKGEIIDTDSDIVPDGCGITTKMMMLDGLDDTQREIATRYGRRAQVVDAIGRTAGYRPGFLLMDTSSGELRDAVIDARDMLMLNLRKDRRQPGTRRRASPHCRRRPAACARPPTPGRPSSPAILLSPSLRNALRMPGEVADE